MYKNIQNKVNKNPLLHLVICFFFVFLTMYIIFWAQNQIIQTMFIQTKFVFGPIQYKLVPSLLTFIIAFIINRVKECPFNNFPMKQNFICGITFALFLDADSIPNARVDYLLRLVGKSTSIMVVVFVGTFFTSVKDKKSRMTEKEILIGSMFAIISIFQTIFLNIFYDSQEQESQSNFLGIIVFFLFLFSAGFGFDYLAQSKQHKISISQYIQKINMWISAFLLVIGIINYRSLGNYVMFLCSNKYGLLYTILCSISWGIFQIFAFRLVKYFRQHMLPISIFIFHSLAFYEFDMIKNMTSFVSIVLLIVTTMLAIYWQVKNREKVKVTEEMGSEIGLKVINNQSMTLHDYEVMQK